jgi:hypothetical protein
LQSNLSHKTIQNLLSSFSVSKLPRIFHLTFQSLLVLVCMEREKVSDFYFEISFC